MIECMLWDSQLSGDGIIVINERLELNFKLFPHGNVIEGVIDSFHKQ